MARISYVDPATITDSEIRGWLDEAVRAGTGTRKSGDSRASTQHHAVFTMTRKMLFDDGAGVLEHELKKLTRAYVAYTVECSY